VVIEEQVRLQLRIDQLVAVIDDAERWGQRLRVNALLLELELLYGERMRLHLEDRHADA
jgi:hypothetical protein